MKLCIQNARIVDLTNRLDFIGDILCENGLISKIGTNLSCEGADIIDASGLIAAAGLFDMHVHLRDPGFTYKEDIASATAAAAAGGVTSLLAMPNSRPAIDSPEAVTDILSRSVNMPCRVYLCGAVSKGLLGGEMTDFDALKTAGIVALSDDGVPVKTPEMLAAAMKQAHKFGLFLTCHCEDLELADGGIINKGPVSEALGVPGISNASEDMAVKREIDMAERLGVSVHIAHVSTQGSVSLVREAKARGVQVTCETAPHYFIFTEEELFKKDANFRMNPPLRSETDRQAIVEGLQDGTIDCIVTDHAPHSPEEKQDFLTALNGILGLETSLSAAYTYLVKPGLLTFPEALYKMSKAQANILSVSGGSLTEGQPADILLFDPGEIWTVDRDKLKSKSRNTPFHGMTLTGRVKYTLLNGKIVYHI